MEESQLEQAVLCCVDPSVNPEIKKQALSFLDQMKVQRDYWKFCLHYFLSKPNGLSEAKFFALQVLDDTLTHRMESLSSEDRLFLRQSLVTWMRDETPRRTSEPIFLKNKMVKIVVLLFSQEYLTTWPTFFNDLISYLTLGTPLVDLFLRICHTIDDEIVARYIPRSGEDANLTTMIKDKMREKDIESLVEVWYQILATFHDSNPELVNMCLSCIGIYASWIEIGLIVSDRFVLAYYNFLANPRHQDSAAECVNAIILKKMKAEKKISLIQALNLHQVLQKVGSTIESEKMAVLVNDVGVTLTNCWVEFESEQAKQLQVLCYSLLGGILGPFFQLLANEDESLSSSVLEFSQAILAIFKQEKKTSGVLSPEKRAALNNLLQVTIMKMKLPTDYRFNTPGDDEQSFNENRNRLKTQFENISAIDEEMMVEFVLNAVSMTLKNLDKCHFTDAELALKLLYIYADGVRGQIRISKTEKNCDVRLIQLLQLLMQSNVSSYPHQAVQLEYFENVVRYAKFFDSFPEYLDPVLVSFLDARGLHHPEPPVRGRVMYLFFKFLKSLKNKIYNKVDTILNSTYDLLILPDANLTIVRPVRRRLSQNSISAEKEHFNDQLQLFETVGMVISMEQVPEAATVRYLNLVTSPIYSRMDEVLSRQLYKSDTEDNPIYQTILHHAITAIGSIAKGFPSSSTPDKSQEWEGIFQQALERALSTLQALPNSAVIKEATRFLFQRLVACLGSSILPFLPSVISGLLTNCQQTDVIEFLPLISQLMYRFQDKFYPILNDLMGSLLPLLFGFLKQEPQKITIESTGAIVNSYETQQLLELRRAYVNLIFSVMTAGQMAVFTSSANIGHFEEVLASILRLAMEEDIQIQKHCMGTLSKLVEVWAEPTLPQTGGAAMTNGKHGLTGFNQFILQQLLPLCFRLPFRPNFNLADGQSYLILGEICGLKRLMLQQMGPGFLQYLQTTFLPSMGLAPAAITEYLQALQASDAKQFTKYFRTLIQSKKLQKA